MPDPEDATPIENDNKPVPVTNADAPKKATNRTRVALRADMTIDEEPVAIEGMIGSNFFLQLSKPASLGTPISFAYWLRDTYGVDNLEVLLPEAFGSSAAFKAKYRRYRDGDEAARKEIDETIATHLTDRGIPKQVHAIMKSAMLAELTITDLLIDIESGEGDEEGSRKMMFGLSVGFPSPLPLIPNIDLNKMSILIMNAPEDYTFPERVELPPPPPLAQATGSIAFSALPTAGGAIMLGDDTWTFVAKGATPTGRQVALDDDLGKTLTALATALNAHGAGDTAKCRYAANPAGAPTRLDVAFKTVGSLGNTFTLGADEASKGTPAAKRLTGGAGEAIPACATGSIRFNGKPENGGKIALNGVEWTFGTSATKVEDAKVKIGEDAKATVAALAAALNASANAKIATCAYVAREATLLVTAKQPGADGNDITLAALEKSNATAMTATLTGGA
jgi:hypothetical protein